MTAWLQIFLDTPADEVERAVAFWSAVTGSQPSERRGEDGRFLTLVPAAGSAYVKVQAVAAPAGIHLDLDSRDRPAAVARARALGATPAWTYEGVEVMRSPGGFTFCHTLVEGEPALVRDGSTILDQVCLDVPDAHWESEVAFWRDLTGRELQQATGPGFARLVAPDQPRILLQHLGEPDGPVRAHPDLASADRAGDTERHVALGARLVRVNDFWTVLTAPGGQVYCLTDRDPATGVVG
ncbi:VOC family protein [Nocardioides sp. zg-1308]|uniref:VOC family protein n=1 Tax=Nocardioides renjunii TaxID=3095075 RepID=A0ABU5KAP4_9ACTN|nr:MULTISPECIES: VOC family protein [unclassified Nocardioides]MDZ5661996.1 VOC family protein [Nocardioides sp. S-58]NPD06296.1 VOC family protein [Nocardioides sp. zg-1308]